MISHDLEEQLVLFEVSQQMERRAETNVLPAGGPIEKLAVVAAAARFHWDVHHSRWHFRRLHAH